MKALKGCFIILALAVLAIVIFGFLSMRNYGDRKITTITITDLSTSARPKIGQVVKLRVKVKSTHDEPYTEIAIELPEDAKLVEGDLVWRGSLTASKSKTHEVSICVLSGVDIRIEAQAKTWDSADRTSLTGMDDEEKHFITFETSPPSTCP